MLIPIVLFAYARPEHLKRTLDCLRENCIPLIYAFADGLKTPEVAERVNEVRQMLHAIDWCEVHLVERTENFGLGKSILAGVTEVFEKHEAIIVFEDDLICVPGTYRYLCAALEHYKDTPNVMSVTGWTHPRVTPKDITDQPYFDGRTECLVWGSWARAWNGMEHDAMALVNACKKDKIDIYRYGIDLLEMAKTEKERNIWAVRFSYLHILNKGMCLRPPFSLVQHIGYGPESANVKNLDKYIWHAELPEQCPKIPKKWPVALENPECPKIWQRECGGRPTLIQNIKNKLSNRDMMSLASKISKAFQISSWIRVGNRLRRQRVEPVIEKLIFFGGISEYLAIKWLLRIYQSKFRLDWEFNKTPPQFYIHRIGMTQFTFGKMAFGAYAYFRGFFTAQAIQDGDKLLDIGCGDGFFTKRFYSAKCSHVDGIDIEPSAILYAERINSAENIKYHVMDAVESEFPEREYDVIVWDGALGHFSPNTLEIMLQKIVNALSQDGIFIGSESLGDGGVDHLTRIYSLDNFGGLFSKYFKYVEVSSKDYKLNNDFIRREAYWRCSNKPDRLQKLNWNKYYTE